VAQFFVFICGYCEVQTYICELTRMVHDWTSSFGCCFIGLSCMAALFTQFVITAILHHRFL